MGAERQAAQHEHDRERHRVTGEERPAPRRGSTSQQGVICDEQDWGQNRALLGENRREIERRRPEPPVPARLWRLVRAPVSEPGREHEERGQQLRAAGDVRDGLRVNGENREQETAQERRAVIRARALQSEPSQRGHGRMEKDVDEMEAEWAGAEDRSVDREGGDRQRAIESVVFAGDVPVGLDEQYREMREGDDGRIALDEPDVVESESITEGAPVYEDGGEGAKQRPPQRRPRRHQKLWA